MRGVVVGLILTGSAVGTWLTLEHAPFPGSVIPLAAWWLLVIGWLMTSPPRHPRPVRRRLDDWQADLTTHADATRALRAVHNTPGNRQDAS